MPYSVSGASDRHGSPASPRELIWVAVNANGDTRCAGCGKPIRVGDPMYEIVVDGRELNLGPTCGGRHMEVWRNERAKDLSTS